MATASRLSKTFMHLGEAGAATPMEVTETFWSDLGSGRFEHLGPGRLVSYVEFDSDWDSWEIHPEGDEIVCLFFGVVELEAPSGNETVTLSEPGTFVRVPRGTWHTARVREPSAAMFITAGEGTQHRPV